MTALRRKTCPPGVLGDFVCKRDQVHSDPCEFPALKGMEVRQERAEDKQCMCAIIILQFENGTNHNHNNINDDHNGNSVDKSSQYFLALPA